MSRTTLKVIGGSATVLLMIAGMISAPRAQGSINISFSKFGAGAWPAGPDYATDVLGDPWDFCNDEDVAPDPLELVGWQNFTINAPGTPCQAGGTTVRINGGIDTQMSLLFRGRYGFNNPGRNGRRFPIDPNKYQKFAYRMTAGVGGDAPRISWFLFPWEDPSLPFGDQGDGVRFGDTTIAGPAIYTADLTANLAGGRTWTSNGVVRGLRISPTTGLVGHDIFFDWVRLTAPDNAPDAAMQTISWTGGSGTATVQVIDSNGTALTAATGVSANSLSWNYGVLPPGSYTVRVTRGGVSGQRAFTINAPPVINLTEPNETGGADWASTVLGNGWDMSSASDVQITGLENYTPVPPNFDNGILTATSTTNDSQITLLNSNNNATPIDSTRYRYLTFSMLIDDINGAKEWNVARLFWSSAQFLNGFTSTTSKDIAIWPGWHSYTIDLGSLTTGPDKGLESSSAAQVWTAAAMRNFRLDPSEEIGRTFHFDYVKLAAMAETSGGGFTLRWNATGSSSASVALYYDNDQNPGNGKTQITGGVPAGTGQYFWNTAGVPPGEYWIYAESNDGIQTYGRYSTGQLRVLGGTSSSPNPAMVIDGPVSGSTTAEPFTLSGWAIDRGASSGSGVDAVQVWAFPLAGGSPIFAGGATLGGSRPDIANLFGAQFGASGYALNVTGLAPGTYDFSVSARSTVTGTFNQSQHTTVTITAAHSNPLLAIDAPANGTTVGSTFGVSGWAADLGSSTGTGIDGVHVWAFPTNGGAATFLGLASYGTSRPDVGALIGGRFTNSGYALSATLQPGTYQITVYVHSVVTGGFVDSRSTTVTVGAPTSNPAMVLDTPLNGATVSRPFTLSGWAIDRGATSGTGISQIHVWAFPVGGGAPQFLGQANYGSARPDIASLFGSAQFTNSGFSLSVTSGQIAKGTWDITVYANSVLGGFNQSRTVRLTIN
jgi:hypothetical protein